MNFGAILHKAQKNENVRKEPIRYYSTKFEPPKKEQRSKTQQLSANIKKFLEKRDQEERMKQLEMQKKKEELIALRSKDKKAMKRVNVMLKRTKSANQSAIQDAVDNDNTALTLAGPAQPDEDDYGYVSQEASAFYNKLMEKYSKMPDEPKFSLEKRKSSTNLNSTKDRVRAALEKEKEESQMPHKRKRKNREDDLYDQEQDEKKVKENNEKPKPKLPPPMNFNDLLKLAEKKQFEPIVIEKKSKEEETPMTKKQKREMERVKEWQERKNRPAISVSNDPKTEGGQKLNKVPKSKPLDNEKLNKAEPEQVKKKIDWGPKHPAAAKINMNSNIKPPTSLHSKNTTPNNNNTINNIVKPERNNGNNKVVEKSQLQHKVLSKPTTKPKEFPPRDLMKPKPQTTLNSKPKQFPPADVRRRPMEKPKLIKRRPILEDDDEDSEMDDFIDDGPEEGEEDYSKYIKEIFGYNRSKYAHYEDDEDDLMESSFAQQMKEEVISTKMGIMEDLEDMKLEEEHKRRKALMKKKLSKKK